MNFKYLSKMVYVYMGSYVQNLGVILCVKIDKKHMHLISLQMKL